MSQNAGFCRGDYVLQPCVAKNGLDSFITLNNDAILLRKNSPVLKRISVTITWQTAWKRSMRPTFGIPIGKYWQKTLWKAIIYRFAMQGLSGCPNLKKWFAHRKRHSITTRSLKNDTLRITLAHPENKVLRGTAQDDLPSCDLSESFDHTAPGYFWYLSLHPKGVGQVQITFGGGMSLDYMDDDDAQDNFRQLKTLLDEVNVETVGARKVYRGLCSQSAEPGHLSHLERPNLILRII